MLSTRVMGTFGCLDPEYFQFTEKSDVYSFGVVVVELLTGEKAVSAVRSEMGRNLAAHFLQSMEENRLFDILDPKVVKEGRHEEIVAIAKLAQRGLHFKGKSRPTIKELEGWIHLVWQLQHQNTVLSFLRIIIFHQSQAAQLLLPALQNYQTLPPQSSAV